MPTMREAGLLDHGENLAGLPGATASGLMIAKCTFHITHKLLLNFLADFGRARRRP